MAATKTQWGISLESSTDRGRQKGIESDKEFGRNRSFARKIDMFMYTTIGITVNYSEFSPHIPNSKSETVFRWVSQNFTVIDSKT
jgi:hypothetical protein